ncbi:MAG: hypothetical protein Q4D29_10920 [Lachnospiraceae bacterium]|nr:hypothetical protein [Lachnospiraceae bacterium]
MNEALNDTVVNEPVKVEEKPVIKEESNKLPTKADKAAVLKAMQEKIDAMEDSDTKILAELLLELKKDQEEESAYAKRHMIYSIVTAVVSIGIALACVFVLVPQILGLLNNVNTVIDNTNKIVTEAEDMVGGVSDMMTEVDGVIKNLTKTTDELSQTDFTGIMKNVDGIMNDVNDVMKDVTTLVESSQKTIDTTMTNINALDFESLNNSIKALNDVVSPLAKMFGGGKSTTKLK